VVQPDKRHANRASALCFFGVVKLRLPIFEFLYRSAKFDAKYFNFSLACLFYFILLLVQKVSYFGER